MRLFSFLQISFLAFVLLSTHSAQAVVQHTCGTDRAQGIEYYWCIDKDDASRNKDVLYYFHGAGRSEQGWHYEKENQDIQAAWQKLHVQQPIAISVSFGKTWLFSEWNRNGGPGNYTAFVNTIMPTLEAKIGGVHGRRLIKGESMGGFNGSQLLLKNSELFDRVALACPAIPIVGPFTPPWETAAFLGRNNAFIKTELVIGYQLWLLNDFPDPGLWERHNPLNLVRRMTLNSPRVYVSCGNRDEFGFFEGAQSFARAAKERGVKVLWQPTEGGHCGFDAVTIAKFLAP